MNSTLQEPFLKKEKENDKFYEFFKKSFPEKSRLLNNLNNLIDDFIFDTDFSNEGEVIVSGIIVTVMVFCIILLSPFLCVFYTCCFLPCHCCIVYGKWKQKDTFNKDIEYIRDLV